MIANTVKNIISVDFWPLGGRSMKERDKNRHGVRPEQIAVGALLQFGATPQALLSGRKLRVGEVRTYRFGEVEYASFTLRQEREADLYLILAEAEGERYLAISRKLSLEERAALFPDQPLEILMDEPIVKSITCNDTLAEYRGWLAGQYRRALPVVEGRLIPGNWLGTPLSAAVVGMRSLRYCLWTNATGEYAVELEQYDNGATDVYVTVYRPASDIVQVMLPPRQSPSLERQQQREQDAARRSREEKEADVLRSHMERQTARSAEILRVPAFEQAASARAELAEALPAMPRLTIPEPVDEALDDTPEEAPEEALPALQSASEPAMEVAADLPSSHSYMPTVTQDESPRAEAAPVSRPAIAAAVAAEHLVACRMEVAASLIDEAMRNHFSLEQVARRVLGLPAASGERVYVPLSLSAGERTILAERYGVDAQDIAALHEQIAEELAAFAGVK